MLSIIVPTLNEEKYLGKLLDCLTSQSYQDFEVIVVDGNSDDKTKEVVSKSSKRLDIKLGNSKKRNVAYQRNLGVKYAKFDRLLFLDADVVFNSDFLGKIIDVDFGSVTLLPLKGRWHDKLFFNLINKTFLILQYIKPYSLGACIITNKQLHNQIGGFNDKLGFCEEFYYVRKGSKYSRFRIRKDAVVFTSVRRFEKKGTKDTIKIWLKSFFYNLFTNRFLKVRYFHH